MFMGHVKTQIACDDNVILRVCSSLSLGKPRAPSCPVVRSCPAVPRRAPSCPVVPRRALHPLAARRHR